MPLIPAKCTQCNAELQIDPTKEQAYCEYCHTPFYTEKAVNNYNVSNVTNVSAGVVNLQDERSLDNRVRSGETFILLDDYAKARKVFASLVEECPYDYRGWFGMMKVRSVNFTNRDITRREWKEIVDTYNKAKKVADEAGRQKMAAVCDPYLQEVSDRLDALEAASWGQYRELQKKYTDAVNQLNADIGVLQDKFSRVDYLSTPMLVIAIAAVALVMILSIVSENPGTVLGAVISSAAIIVLYRIFKSVWNEKCMKERDEIRYEIAQKNQNIYEWNNYYRNCVAQLNSELEKATGQSGAIQ